MKPHIGIVGLGIMGGAMAECLIAAGYRVCGYDMQPVARRRLKKAGGRALSSSAGVANSADVVITSLPSVSALDDVVNNIISMSGTARKSKLIVIETSTLPIADKERAFRQLKKTGAIVLDCPISGTARRMREGAWTIFVSGNTAACKRARPIFEVFTRNAPYVGVFGNGSKMKYVANLLVAIHNVASAEAMVLGMKAGLPPQAIFDLVKAGAGNSRVFELRAPMMVKGKYDTVTMKIDVWDKDMQVIGDYARKIGVKTPIFDATKPIYVKAQKSGLGMKDTAAVCAVLEQMARLKRTRGKKTA